MKQANNGSSVQRTHPLLYWMTIVYVVGLPNFLQFDTTGRTHDFGLFNFTSISRMALTLVIAYLLIVNLAIARRCIFPRKIRIPIAVWFLLLAWCTIASILQPESHLGPPAATDLPLSLYRLLEWTLAFLLILTLCAREPAEDLSRLIVELIIRTSWIIVLMVWIALLIFPHLAYGSDENGSPPELGGTFINNGTVAFCSCCIFLYSHFFVNRINIKWLGFLVAFVTLALTRARTPQIAFLVALGCYVIVYPLKPGVRLAAATWVLFIGGLAAAFSNSLLAYFARGQSAYNLATLDDRLLLWQTCWKAIQERPILGYGFVAGVKNAIRDHWPYAHWLPPHAHNDLIEMTLQAGLPACMLLVYLYLWIFRECVQNARLSRQHLFLFLLVIQLTVYASTGIVLSYTYTTMSAVMILCHIGLTRNTDPMARLTDNSSTDSNHHEDLVSGIRPSTLS